MQPTVPSMTVENLAACMPNLTESHRKKKSLSSLVIPASRFSYRGSGLKRRHRPHATHVDADCYAPAWSLDDFDIGRRLVRHS